MAETNAGTKGVNGTKTFASIAGLIAIISIVLAVNQSTERGLTDQVNFMKETVTKLEQRLERHQDLSLHTGAAQSIAKLSEKFVEAETQFSDVERRIRDLEEWQTTWFENAPERDARQDERLYHLERHLEKE